MSDAIIITYSTHCLSCRAIIVNFPRGRWDYELYMRFDLYTNKHTQWFYFSVENMRVGQTYRFTVVNFYKVQSKRESKCTSTERERGRDRVRERERQRERETE